MWIVDTCLVLDVLDDDPAFGRISARILAQHLEDGLAICPVTYIELAPAFDGDAALEDEFLRGLGARHDVPWTDADTLAAHQAWMRHVRQRRSGVAPRRPIADVLIGAFASRHEGLITRNLKDFRRTFPNLELLDPSVTTPGG